jgi:hypothetical protein
MWNEAQEREHQFRRLPAATSAQRLPQLVHVELGGVDTLSARAREWAERGALLANPSATGPIGPAGAGGGFVNPPQQLSITGLGEEDQLRRRSVTFSLR